MTLLQLFVVVFVTLAGLMIGSFLNVVIYRVPRGESVVRPRSHCPNCGAGIRPRDEIPVLSWLLLGRRCRDCRVPISARYAVVETCTAAMFAALTLRFMRDVPAQSLRVLPAFLYLGAIGIVLALVDFDTHKLPNKLTLPSYVVATALLGVTLAFGVPVSAAVRAVAGLAVMYIIYFILWFAAPGGMGFGDVKLSGVLGLYLGWLGWPTLAVGLLAGWFLGGATGVLLLASGRAGRKTAIPFGPFMIAGAFLAIFAGEPIGRLWLR